MLRGLIFNSTPCQDYRSAAPGAASAGPRALAYGPCTQDSGLGTRDPRLKTSDSALACVGSRFHFTPYRWTNPVLWGTTAHFLRSAPVLRRSPGQRVQGLPQMPCVIHVEDAAPETAGASGYRHRLRCSGGHLPAPGVWTFCRRHRTYPECIASLGPGIPKGLHHSAQDCEAPSYPGCVRPNIPPDAADAVKKRAAGAVWAWRSRGKCFFVMPTEGNLSVITKSIRSAFPAGD